MDRQIDARQKDRLKEKNHADGEAVGKQGADATPHATASKCTTDLNQHHSDNLNKHAALRALQKLCLLMGYTEHFTILNCTGMITQIGKLHFLR